MSTQPVKILMRSTAVVIWFAVALLYGSAKVGAGEGSCTTSTLNTGCASNYGVLEEAKCAGEACVECISDPGSFCAPDEPCEVDVCRLDDYRRKID